MAAVLKAGQWSQVAQWWVTGISIPWEKGQEGDRLRRVSLPTYPFARERYWQTAADTLSHDREAAPSPTLVVPSGREGNALVCLRQDLTDMVSEILKVDRRHIDAEASMLEFGFTSLTFTEFLKQIAGQFAIEPSLELFFDLDPPTIVGFSQRLFDSFGEPMRRYYQEVDSPNVSAGATLPPPTGDDPPEKAPTAEEVEETLLTLASDSLVFDEQGYDPRSIRTLLDRINDSFGLAVTPTDFSAAPSPGAFIGRLMKDHKNRLFGSSVST